MGVFVAGFAFAVTDHDTMLLRSQHRFQHTHNYGSYSAAMPILSEYAAECLEPVRIRQPRDEFGGAILVCHYVSYFFGNPFMRPVSHMVFCRHAMGGLRFRNGTCFFAT